MPTYQYSCRDCSEIKGNQVCDIEENIDGWHPELGDYVFYKTCKMDKKPKKPKCPNCGGKNTYTCFIDQKNMSWIRGNGIVNDTAGARRDMNRHTLENNDPYGHMRQSGEVDHMLDQCRRGGMDSEKILKQGAKTSNEAAASVKGRETVKLSDIQEAVLAKMEDEDLEFSAFEEFDDASGVLSSLMPNYVFKRKNGKFALMAEGRSYIDKLLNQE